MTSIHLLLEDESLIALGAQDALEDGNPVRVASCGDETAAALDAMETISGLVTDIRWAQARTAGRLHAAGVGQLRCARLSQGRDDGR